MLAVLLSHGLRFGQGSELSAPHWCSCTRSCNDFHFDGPLVVVTMPSGSLQLVGPLYGGVVITSTEQSIDAPFDLQQYVSKIKQFSTFITVQAD